MKLIGENDQKAIERKRIIYKTNQRIFRKTTAARENKSF